MAKVPWGLNSKFDLVFPKCIPSVLFPLTKTFSIYVRKSTVDILSFSLLQVTNEGRLIDGLYVHYRPIWRPVHALHLRATTPFYQPRWGSAKEGEEYVPWSTVTVLNSGASSYVLTRLEPNSLYQIFLVPFRGANSGAPSAMLSNATEQEGNLCIRLE